MEKILLKMQDLLDVQDLTSDSVLNQYEEWDSLTRVALVSFAQKYYKINITLDELDACRNIRDIYNLFNKATGGGDRETLINPYSLNISSHLLLFPTPFLKVS